MLVYRLCVIVLLAGGTIFKGYSQCATAAGDQTTSGSGSWIGYVYDGANSFNSSTYSGTITESENFDESWCGDDCNFTANSGCSVRTETFSVRFKMSKTFTCGSYRFTIGADDGVRLSLDGTYISTSLYNDHGYATTSVTVFISAGSHDLILDFYENGGSNRVTFNDTQVEAVTTSSGGIIAADQSSCATGFDPAAFTSTSPAGYCGSSTAISYQWQKSTTSSSTGFADIGGATALTYDEPGPLNATTWYRRQANNGSGAVYSTVATVTIDPPPADQTLAGTNTWVGHVYDGADNYTTNYQGQITEAQTFDEGFCGDNCTTAINGCDFNSDTFSVRFRMSYTFTGGARDFSFTAGGDDGYRFSTDGGTTWLINNYGAHSYVTSTSTQTLVAGTYNFILEYYENTGQNRVTFTFSSTLPVTWSYLDGYFLNEQNFVVWKTATEKNNNGFAVERSTDGKTFDSLGFVAGHGTTNQPNQYEFQDTKPYGGWNYYRIKQIDHDRHYEYSELIPVYSAISTASAIFPNPATDELYISHLQANQTIGVVLRGVNSGRTYTLTNDPKQPSKFSLKNVSPGMYIVTVTIDNAVHSEKLVVY